MPYFTDSSRVDSTGRAHAGSQRQIQTFVNERKTSLNSAICRSLARYDLDGRNIEWVSPLKPENYVEYQDAEFLERVGLSYLIPQLQEFWPRGGPCWDALARIEGGCILVEAKSHVAEIYGRGCGAISRDSKIKIQKALGSTKVWLGVSPDVAWTERLYQSANRYASLYFLREIAAVQAFLVNVYLIGDPRTPTTREEWDTAIGSVNRELGLVDEVPHSASVFLTAE